MGEGKWFQTPYGTQFLQFSYKLPHLMEKKICHWNDSWAPLRGWTTKHRHWHSSTQMPSCVPAPLPGFAHPWSGSLLRTLPNPQTRLIPIQPCCLLRYFVWLLITFTCGTTTTTTATTQFPSSPPPSTHLWKRPLFCSCWSRMFSSFRGLGMNPISQPSFTRRPIHQSLLNFCRLGKIGWENIKGHSSVFEIFLTLEQPRINLINLFV